MSGFGTDVLLRDVLSKTKGKRVVHSLYCTKEGWAAHFYDYGEDPKKPHVGSTGFFPSIEQALASVPKALGYWQKPRGETAPAPAKAPSMLEKLL